MIKDFKVFKLAKGNGKSREIYAPKGAYKTALKSAVGNLTRKAAKLDVSHSCHAFMRAKSCVTNAKAHVGHNFTLSMDLENFFDSVKVSMLKGLLSKEELELCFIDGVARQGLPTSPAIANMAFIKTDEAIIKALKKKQIQAIYTRYADDLTFSFDKEEEVAKIIMIVKQAVGRSGFKVNHSKTKLQKASGGRIIITGIGVDSEGVHPTRKVLRKIRAAKHQAQKDSLQGLQEWAKCKEPAKRDTKKEQDVESLLALSKLWRMGLRNADLRHIPTKETIELGSSCIVSGDPLDMLGMSTFTTGWTSCMSKTGKYKSGVPFWILLKGTRIAYQESDKTISFGKVTRKKMIARTLVHELRNGVLVYDRFFGNNTSTLKKELEKAGVISMKQAKKEHAGEKVRGNVISRYKPWFDNLNSHIGTRKGTSVKVRYATI